MNFDSFITLPTNKQSHLKHWAFWSLFFTAITMGSIILLHQQALKRYAAYTTTCRKCEKIVADSTQNSSSDNFFEKKYVTIAEQANTLRAHLAAKERLFTLTRTLLTGVQAPITVQSLTLSSSEGTITIRCPRTYSLTKLTQKLAALDPDALFFVTRINQHDDGLLVTLRTQLKTTT